MLPHFLRHYWFARRITVFDNESTDRTCELALADPRVRVQTWKTGGLQDNLAMIYIKDNCWRGCDADYVVVCDMDEFIDCSPLESFGRQELAFRCVGRNMIGRDGEALRSIRRYDPTNHYYDKIAVFSPRIQGINYEVGCHAAAPACVIVEGLLVLRHYALLGEEHVLRRYRMYSSRISNSDRSHRWGWQYLESEEQIRTRYRRALAASVEDSPFGKPG